LRIDPNIELQSSITERQALTHFRSANYLLLATLALACTQSESPPEAPPEVPETLWVEIAGEPFELELALDADARYRGLSGRLAIEPNGGMLFVNSVEGPRAMVMRDCTIPIDVAFLDSAGEVVAIHEMRPELPRRPGESRSAYESRLRVYRSGAPTGFAIETAGGRLDEIGLRVGDQVVFDIARTLDLARRVQGQPR
jgi:uncharacterized membrane protein (UPF0127 family)